MFNLFKNTRAELPPAYSVDVTPTLQVVATAEPAHPNDSENTTSNLLVKLEVNPSSEIPRIKNNLRTAVDICAVIDISGSMGTEAVVKTENEQSHKESSGLSVLDVVKHAVNTIVSTMTEYDRLSIVSFSAYAKVELPLTIMDPGGKEKAKEIVKKLSPQDSTNLWGGLYLGLEEFRKISGVDSKNESNQHRIGSIFLLTDGMPNVEPPRGHHAMLKEYKDRNSDTGNFPIINTFGFGYSLDSQLLNDLAIIGEGQYSFIPDAGFVGTTFIHATTTLYTTFARRARVSISPLNGASLAITKNAVPGGFDCSQSDWGVEIEVGSILYGQSRDIVVPLQIPKYMKTNMPYSAVTVRYEPVGSPNTQTENIECSQRNPELLLEILNQTDRLEVAALIQSLVVDIAKQCFKPANPFSSNQGTTSIPDALLSDATEKVQSLIQRIEKAQTWTTNSPNDRRNPKFRSLELVKDLQGQVLEAFGKCQGKAAYTRWGQHYLPSLARTHLLQICNNFKDPGIQVYVSDSAQKLRLEFDNLFLSLPPPMPSRRFSTNPTRHVNMNTFHNSSNPCFSGGSSISMADGTSKRVDEVKKDDLVLVDPETKEYARIVCVLKTIVDGIAPLVKLNENLHITAYHPIFVEGKWRFPIELANAQYQQCDAVYSFVLDSVLSLKNHRHTIVIGGIQCATLGHGLTGEVIEHAYLGSHRVLDDLEKLKGWKEGLVVISGTEKGDDGKVCGFKESGSKFLIPVVRKGVFV